MSENERLPPAPPIFVDLSELPEADARRRYREELFIIIFHDEDGTVHYGAGKKLT